MRFLSHFTPASLLAVVGITLLVESGAWCQTVRPVIVEYQSTANGKFELVNDGLTPLSVVLEPRSFTITDDGTGVYSPLEGNVHLQLSAMSFRIPPKQSRFVFYKATADRLPAWFVIYSVCSGRPARSGFNVEVDLPHTVYLRQKASLEKQDVGVESFEYLPEEKRAVITVSNSSEKLERALEWRLSSKATKISGNGFPLLPKGRRRLEVDWDSASPPEVFSVRFQHFTFKQDLGALRQ